MTVLCPGSTGSRVLRTERDKLNGSTADLIKTKHNILDTEDLHVHHKLQLVCSGAFRANRPRLYYRVRTCNASGAELKCCQCCEGMQYETELHGLHQYTAYHHDPDCKMPTHFKLFTSVSLLLQPVLQPEYLRACWHQGYLIYHVDFTKLYYTVNIVFLT